MNSQILYPVERENAIHAVIRKNPRAFDHKLISKSGCACKKSL